MQRIKTHNGPDAMQGTPQEESRDPPAPPAASQCGPHSLMFRPKGGGGVLSLALHLRSAAFLCLSAQHAFTSSPVMDSEGSPQGTCRGRPPDSGIQALLVGAPPSAGLWTGADSKSAPPVWEGAG
ncbi:unnamed protein product [Boreogadus saida]